MRWYKCKKERKQNSSLIVGQVLGVWLRLSLIKVLLFKRRAFHDEISDSRVNRVQEIGLPSCGTIWLFLVMLSFSSQLLLEIFCSLQIPKLPAEFDRMKNWSEARESWNYVLGWASLIAQRGGRQITQRLTQTTTKCFLSLLRCHTVHKIPQ